MDKDKKLKKLYENEEYDKALKFALKHDFDFDIDRYCYKCDSKMEKDLMNVKGKLFGKNNITLEGFKGYACPNCDFKILSSQAVKKLEEWLNNPNFKFEKLI